MKYIHNRYAGNKGDLWKHFVLHCLCKGAVSSPNQAFRYLDCHGGSGLYNLRDGEEWKRGLGEINPESKDFKYFYKMPWFKTTWERFLKEKRYLGSWAQVAENFRNFEIELCDHNPEAIANSKELASSLSCSINSHAKDSFDFALNHGTSFDLIFMDPAYSLKDGLGNDWLKIPEIYKTLEHQLAIFWYPLYGPEKPNRLVDETGGLAFEIHWPTKRKSSFVPKGCGMLANLKAAEILEQNKGILKDFARLLSGDLLIRDKVKQQTHHLMGDLGAFTPMSLD